MAQKPKLYMHDVFNEIAEAHDSASVITALDKIDQLKVKDKREILDQLETAIMADFVENATSVADLQTDRVLADLEGLAEVFFGGSVDSTNNSAREKEMLEFFHIALLATDRVVKGKKDTAEPVLKDIMNSVSKLSDAKYNSFRALTMTLARAVEPHRNKKNANPFRK